MNNTRTITVLLGISVSAWWFTTCAPKDKPEIIRPHATRGKVDSSTRLTLAGDSTANTNRTFYVCELDEDLIPNGNRLEFDSGEPRPPSGFDISCASYDYVVEYKNNAGKAKIDHFLVRAQIDDVQDIICCTNLSVNANKIPGWFKRGCDPTSHFVEYEVRGHSSNANVVHYLRRGRIEQNTSGEYWICDVDTGTKKQKAIQSIPSYYKPDCQNGIIVEYVIPKGSNLAEVKRYLY